ncbi:MAG: UbiA family prenyltransferase, partial [Bacteroidota bacterium]
MIDQQPLSRIELAEHPVHPAAPAGQAPMPTATVSPARDYLELAKPEITFLVVISALAGFLLGSPGDIDWLRLIAAAVGVALSSAGASMLNHAYESTWDARMKRTASRPIPSGRIPVDSAKKAGFLAVIAGIARLCPLTNPLTAVLA